MQNLSRELIDLVLDHVQSFTSNGTLASYASISRAWQSAIEARTMKRIFTRHQDDLDTFSTIFSPKQPHRRHGLREFYLHTRLPTMSFTTEDHAKNNTCFRDVTTKLLTELESWNSTSSDAGRIEPLRISLRFNAFDRSKAGGPGAWPPENTFLTMPEGFLTKMASINVVSHLEIFSSRGSTPHPAAFCQIASKMTSLTQLGFELWEPTLGEGGMRLEHRQALATGLLDFRTTLPNLSALKLHHGNFQYVSNHSFNCPDLTNEDGVDQLSEAIRKLGKAGKLTSLDLSNIPLSSDLFCERNMPSQEAQEQTRCSIWPSLRSMHIYTGLVAANGQWLYTGGPDSLSESSEDEDSSEESIEEGQSSPVDSDEEEEPPRPEYELDNIWRFTPDTAVFNPLIEDLTRAVTRGMPSLKECYFFVYWPRRSPGAVIIQCAGQGQVLYNSPRSFTVAEGDDCSVRRFKATTGPNWELPGSVVEMVQEWVGPTGIIKTVNKVGS